LCAGIGLDFEVEGPLASRYGGQGDGMKEARLEAAGDERETG
jgi:hypothetical protein